MREEEGSGREERGRGGRRREGEDPRDLLLLEKFPSYATGHSPASGLAAIITIV